MKRIFKTAAAGAAALALCFSCAACTDSSQVKKGIPDYSAYEDQLSVEFGAWISPPPAGIYIDPDGPNGKNESYITVERYQEAKAAGLDFVIGLYEQGASSADVLTALDCAAEAGMEYLVRSDLMLYANSTPERLERAIEPVINHEACKGIFVVDEPGADRFHALGAVNRLYKQITDKYFYLNLFPSYARAEQYLDDSYRSYLENYCKIVDNSMISVDYYPFGDDGARYSVSEGLLASLELVQTLSDKYDMEHWEFLQGMKADASSKTPDYYDIRMQIYTSMCFGVQVMQYFCYFTPAGYSQGDVSLAAFIDEQGNQTPIYAAAQKINAEIHAFDHVYLSYDWQGTMTVVGSENEKGKNTAFNLMESPLTSHPRIESVTATQDTVIGTYQDKDGYDGFMVTNYTIPGNRIEDDVAITFKDADAVICYREGKPSQIDLEDGVLNLHLGAGEGVFLIPVKL